MGRQIYHQLGIGVAAQIKSKYLSWRKVYTIILSYGDLYAEVTEDQRCSKILGHPTNARRGGELGNNMATSIPDRYIYNYAIYVYIWYICNYCWISNFISVATPLGACVRHCSYLISISLGLRWKFPRGSRWKGRGAAILATGLGESMCLFTTAAAAITRAHGVCNYINCMW